MVAQRGGPWNASSAGAEMIERSQESVVQVRSGRRGAGAGVIWADGGLVLTNAHVVARGRVEVTLRDGRTFDAETIKHSRDLDLALLRLSDAPDDLPVAPRSRSRATPRPRGSKPPGSPGSVARASGSGSCLRRSRPPCDARARRCRRWGW